jgi:hypothetical protein
VSPESCQQKDFTSSNASWPRTNATIPVTPPDCLIGKETERGWEQAEDISTLLPSLKCYERNTGTASELLRERLQNMSLNTLRKETGLSRNTILRARRGERVHPRSLQRLRIGAGTLVVLQR